MRAVLAPSSEGAGGFASPSNEQLLSRAEAAYLGLAIGDALGATLEFMTPTEIAAEYGVHRDIKGGGWLKLKRGQVTDDTTMSLALGDSILAYSGLEAEHVAQAFSVWMSQKPVDIGNTVRRGIVHYRYSGDPRVPENEYDAGNGACMRCLPVALASYGLPSERVREFSRRQAHVTHNNALSDAGGECVVAMVQLALNGADEKQLLQGPVTELIGAYPQFEFRARPRLNPSAYIVETLQAVFQAFFNTTDFESCLIDVVNRGGDADTTGAIAGMIAGARYGLPAIPERWTADLDASIRERCKNQARALLSLLRGGNSHAERMAQWVD